MQKLIIILGICICGTANAQSPYLSVNVKLDSALTASIQYKIEMRICKPVNGSEVNDYFSNEESSIAFKALKDSDITCGEYIDNYEQKYNSYTFYYASQVFAWEKIIVWKITNASSRDWKKPMYIILPVKIKSFITRIEIKDIGFQTGKVIWLDEKGVTSKNGRQIIELKLRGRKGTDIESCTLKKILD